MQSGTCLFTDYQGKDRIDYRKERPEVELGEEQRGVAVKSEYVMKKGQCRTPSGSPLEGELREVVFSYTILIIKSETPSISPLKVEKLRSPLREIRGSSICIPIVFLLLSRRRGG